MDNQNDIIVQKIKELKSIKPRQEWKDLTKVFLLSKIEEKQSNCYIKSCAKNTEKRQNVKQKFSFWDKKADFKVIREIKKAQKETFFGFLENFTGIPAVFSKAICLICIFTMTASGVFAVGVESQKSVAGDTLYPVKKAIEKTKIAFFPSNNKSQTHTDLASRRLDELNKIAEKSESAEKKKGKMQETIDDFKDEIETAKIALVQPKIDRNTLEKVEAAKKVMAKTEEFKEILEKVPAQMPEEIKEEIGENIDEALEISEEANFAAVEQMIELDIPDAEKLTLVMTELEKVKNKAKKIKEKVEKINSNEIKIEENRIEKENLQENEEISKKSLSSFLVYLIIKSVQAEEEKPVQKEIEVKGNDNNTQDNSKITKIKTLEDIGKTLEDLGELEKLIKEYLAKKDFKTALKLISVFKELIKNLEAEKVIKSTPVSEEPDENSSENNENKSEESEDLKDNNNDNNIEENATEEPSSETEGQNDNFEGTKGETEENKEYSDLEEELEE
ncbi:MAG: hypothetical protein KAS87_00670 [Candidatus Omnitrophica bacterium]|nr:hypothetical protein [Candidatus Omnitrophota bacterium]